MEPSTPTSDAAAGSSDAGSPILSAKEKQRLKMEEKKKSSGQSKGKKAGNPENTSSSTSAKNTAKKSGAKGKNSKAGKSQQKAKEKEAIRKEQARKNFNLHYANQFGEKRWQRLLFALEGPTRYCCLVNTYSPHGPIDSVLDPMRPRLEKLSFVSMTAYSVKQEKMDLDAAPKIEDLLPFPQPAKDEETGVFNYYLLDAASLLPVEALDVKPNDTVLDLCAAPGGKSLAILQKLKLGEGAAGTLTANELSMERRKRLKGVIHGYIFRS
jgi:16S rRNA C967 or C1407 C5-methylase (RsmB/RsmF family)